MLPQKTPGFLPPWRWGVFLRKHCTGLLLDSRSPEFEPINAIYRALKETGFRETYWQFVYPGQIGGLVKSPRSKLVELHVRFFESGMIYAEIEMGRSVLLHFINRRYYLNNYIFKKIQSKISREHGAYFLAATKKYKSLHSNSWPEWSVKNRFMTPNIKKQIRFLSVLSDWRTLAIIMLASVVSSLADRPMVLPIITAAMIVIYLLAPKRS